MLLAAGLASLGHLHHLQSADSLLPALVSVQRWTPFFWEQNRFGMLLPLLALPIEAPLHNLLFQHFLVLAAGLWSFFALARLCLAAGWSFAGALAAALFVGLAPEGIRFDYLVAQPYGLGLALGAAGISAVVGEGRREQVLGLVLLFCSLWVNLAGGVILFPLLGILSLRRGEERWRLARPPLVLLSLASAGAVALTVLAPYGIPYRVSPPGVWLDSWAGLAANAWRELLAPGLLAGVVGTSALLGVSARVIAREAPPRSPGILGLLASAGTYFTFLAVVGWPRNQGLGTRYTLPVAVLLLTALLAGSGARLLATASLPTRVWLERAALALLLVTVLASFGIPTAHRWREDLDAALGERTGDALALGCTHLVGDYWKIWPTVLHAGAVRRERGLAEPLYGISQRSAPTRPQWEGFPAGRRVYCGLPGGELGPLQLRYGLPILVETERRATLVRLAPAP